MRDLVPLRSPLDGLLGNFLLEPVRFESRWFERSVTFPMDVYETETAYRLLADMPGIRKEDIAITIDGAAVTIAAEAKRENPAQERGETLLEERFAGKYYRQLVLGHEIDEANAQARYVDGVLELTLPKSPDAMPKRITIQ